MANVRSFPFKSCEQIFTGLIAPNSTDDHDATAEVQEVVGCVCGATRYSDQIPILQNKDGSLAGNPRGLTVKKLIGDQIPDNRKRAVRELINDLKQLVAFQQPILHGFLLASFSVGSTNSPSVHQA
jgi:hypothetical protein